MKVVAVLLSRQKANIQHESPSCVIEGKTYPLNHGDVVISAITSCTNTSNPSVMLAAGLLAKKQLKKVCSVNRG